jgi:DNA-binding transcriptional MerR regulator
VNKAPDAFRTISEVAEELELPQHVLRFWETRFAQIRPMKRGGGRRYYRPDDVDLLRGIRHLLYGEGYTIRGVQRILKDHGPKFVQTVWQAGAPQPQQAPDDVEVEGTAATAESRERGRGLLSLLPSLLAREKAMRRRGASRRFITGRMRAKLVRRRGRARRRRTTPCPSQARRGAPAGCARASPTRRSPSCRRRLASSPSAAG